MLRAVVLLQKIKTSVMKGKLEKDSYRDNLFKREAVESYRPHNSSSISGGKWGLSIKLFVCTQKIKQGNKQLGWGDRTLTPEVQ